MNLKRPSHELCLRAISKIFVIGDDNLLIVRVLSDFNIILDIPEYNLNESVVVRDFLSGEVAKNRLYQRFGACRVVLLRLVNI